MAYLRSIIAGAAKFIIGFIGAVLFTSGIGIILAAPIMAIVFILHHEFGFHFDD